MKNLMAQTSLFFIISLLFLTLPVRAQLKTDGPYQVSTGEYRMAADVNVDILKDRKTEIWARVFWPKDKTTGAIPNQLPLVAFLHGNHGTCGYGSNPRIDSGEEYTDTGTCPDGSVVTPNHEGYNYIAEQLASYGFLVISINANRGITAAQGVAGDGGLNLARGRLILKHLSLWKDWSTQGLAPSTLETDTNSFIGKVDLTHVGLFGHSRGGEGIRAAYNLYYDFGSVWPLAIPGLNIEALFEIGAVDGQTSRVLDAQNAVWNQLIPICDGDVSDFDGIRPYNRMMQTTVQSESAQKSIYMVYGANHNFFNTEWQENDSYGCSNHNSLWSQNDWQSKRQQTIARQIVTNFFRAQLGSKKLKMLNDALNPMNAVDASIASVTRIEREFTPNPNLDTQLRFDDFLSTSQVQRQSTANISFSVDKGPNALAGTLKVNWNKNQIQDEATLKLEATEPLDVRAMKTLDFRFSLEGRKILTQPLNFSVSLSDQSGSESGAVLLADYVIKTFNPYYDTLYQTVRFPIDKFSGIDLSKLKSIQFKFLAPSVGTVYLAHVRFSALITELMFTEGDRQSQSHVIGQDLPSQNIRPRPQVLITHPAALNRITKVQVLPENKNTEALVAVTFASPARFKIRNALPILKVDDFTFRISRIKNKSDLSQITFYLTLNELDKIKQSPSELKISYKGHSFEEWIFNNTLNQL